MSKNAYIGLFLSALVVSIALVITGKVIYSKHQSTKESPKVVLSPEQQAVVNELRQARAELEQARQELEIAKARQGLDPNAQVSWLIVDRDHSVIANNQPILWGFRSDGLVTWKVQ